MQLLRAQAAGRQVPRQELPDERQGCMAQVQEGRPVMVRCPGLHCDGCGGHGGGLLPLLLIGAAVTATAGALSAVLADILDALLIVTLTATVCMVAVLTVKIRRSQMLLVQRGPAWSGIAASPVQAVPAPPRRAIAARILHIHFHGLAPEDAAAVIRQAVPARPAIEEDL
jgi:predicted lipid-binding transport protein (Tim44 family)